MAKEYGITAKPPNTPKPNSMKKSDHGKPGMILLLQSAFYLKLFAIGSELKQNSHRQTEFKIIACSSDKGRCVVKKAGFSYNRTV
jgi:hypothetical protein